MSAMFHNLSLMQHVDDVSVLDGGQSVGDGNGGSRLHESEQRVLHKFLRFCVESRRGLVENQYWRVLEYCPRDGDALSLTS